MSPIVKDHKFVFFYIDFYFVSLKPGINFFEFEVYFLVNISLGVTVFIKLHKNLLLSADSLNLKNLAQSGKSFIYSRRRIGPRIDTCGTLVVLVLLRVTKFLLAVIYRSPRGHSNNCKIF